jgi:hypothetical protein
LAQVPKFTKLQLNFPYKPPGQTPHRSGSIPESAAIAGNKDLVTQIGGDLHKRLSAIYRNLDDMNTCAVRLSYCLNRSSARITPMRGVRTYKGGDGHLYTISADEMIAYLRETFGEPVKIFDGSKRTDKEWLGAVKPPIQGIFGYDWQGAIALFGATGHVDIGRMPDANVANIIDIGTGAYFIDGPMKVYFWAAS